MGADHLPKHLGTRNHLRNLLSGVEGKVESSHGTCIGFEKEGSGIDVVLLDLNMPGMGGARCLEEILRKDPGARIIVSTGYLDKQQMRGLLQTGAVGFVVKPYKFKAVLQQIRAVLEDRRR
ncbi:response regulator [Desulfoglaeba alkanexedens]|uniref:Response regulator n=1 Tax=Desulfoglaeba alkanexedens ALDC TaxID=980445 RepID=A0A4P8L3S1_9BACT|nr:response regulator transcription factor [Desulfoglaeba alkanexedens]QCQ21645.1 response regulator [Desulfoglaeba alkanexedens ALDC]